MASSEFNGVVLPFNEWRAACLKQTSHEGTDELRQESRKLFASLVDSTQVVAGDGSIAMQTKSSHNEALAKLIQELGSCLTQSRHIIKLWALACLTGAIEGCQSVGISSGILTTLAKFMQRYCGPLEEELDSMEDTEEMVRDSALRCQAALLRSKIDDTPERESESKSETTHDQILIQRLDLAQNTLQLRCALPEQNPEYRHGYGDDEPESVLSDGLSKLPRSRRALCFDVLQAVVEGTPTNGDSSNAPIQQLSSFATLCATCLHGESDPRCLTQLLKLLHEVQNRLYIYFSSSPSDFPTVALFDAVAPYYPLQFTPPPNDTFGITQEGLQTALFNIFAFSKYDQPADTDSMLNLTVGIILERLGATTEEERPDVCDQLEALHDLDKLLFPTKCLLLSPSNVQELSDTLFQTHSQGAQGVVAGSTDGNHRLLADQTRTLVSNFAVAVEVNDNLWKIFVGDRLQQHASILSTSPQSWKGRSTTAYLACLAASGGPRTLQASLQACIPKLVDVFKSISSVEFDEEKVSAASLALAAFFSSFEVAFKRGEKAGISFHPHPLEPFSKNVLLPLATLIGGTGSDLVRKDAITAFCALILVTPSNIFEQEEERIIIDMLLSLVQIVDPIIMSDESDELKLVAAKTLGSVIGNSEPTCTVASVIRDSEAVRQEIKSTILPRMISSLTHEGAITSKRFDTLALARASEAEKTVASSVVEALVAVLDEALKQGKKDNARQIGSILSILLKNGGGNAKEAFFASSISPAAIVDVICGSYTKENLPEKVLRVGMSFLALPTSMEENEQFEKLVDFGHEIIGYILPAFQASVTEPMFHDVLLYVSNVTPPLSNHDLCRLCVMLPLLSTSISSCGRCDHLCGMLIDLLVPLANFAFSGNNKRAQEDAAECLFYIIGKHQAQDANQCASIKVLSESILPELKQSMDRLEQGPSNAAVSSVKNALKLASVLGSAAAVRGNSSTKVANDIAKFLLELAIKGQSQLPYVKQSAQIQFGYEYGPKLCLSAATAFGALLSVESKNPLWVQRLTYIASKALADEELRQSRTNFVGQVSVASYVIVHGTLTGIPKTLLSDVVGVVVAGLKALSDPDHPADVGTEAEVWLAGIVILMMQQQHEIVIHIGKIVPSLLRLLCGAHAIGSKTIALQILCLMLVVVDESSVLLVSRPAIASVLAMLIDHPSIEFRELVIATRNQWLTYG